MEEFFGVIDIKNAVGRWQELKDILSLESDCDLANTLIDAYCELSQMKYDAGDMQQEQSSTDSASVLDIEQQPVDLDIRVETVEHEPLDLADPSLKPLNGLDFGDPLTELNFPVDSILGEHTLEMSGLHSPTELATLLEKTCPSDLWHTDGFDDVTKHDSSFHEPSQTSINTLDTMFSNDTSASSLSYGQIPNSTTKLCSILKPISAIQKNSSFNSNLSQSQTQTVFLSSANSGQVGEEQISTSSCISQTQLTKQSTSDIRQKPAVRLTGIARPTTSGIASTAKPCISTNVIPVSLGVQPMQVTPPTKAAGGKVINAIINAGGLIHTGAKASGLPPPAILVVNKVSGVVTSMLAKPVSTQPSAQTMTVTTRTQNLVSPGQQAEYPPKVSDQTMVQRKMLPVSVTGADGVTTFSSTALENKSKMMQHQSRPDTREKMDGVPTDFLILTCQKGISGLTQVLLESGGKSSPILTTSQRTYYKCLICQKMFADKDQTKTHIEYLRCSKLQHYLRKESQASNKPEQLPDVRQITEVPGIGQLSYTYCREHAKFHIGVQGMKCLHCKLMFHCEKLREVHLMLTHADVQSGSKDHVCTECGKILSSVQALQRHKVMHLDKDQQAFRCSYCGKGCSTVSLLEEHEKTHLPHQGFTCKHCGKDLRSANGIKQHVATCRAIHKPLICPTCGKEFALQSTFDKHMLTHLPEETAEKYCKYMCEVCQKIFTSEDRLQSHALSHSLQISSDQFSSARTNPPLECPVCHKVFYKKNQLMEHSRVHLPAREKVQFQKLSCEMCSKKFHTAMHLEDHMSRSHTAQQNDHKCDTCGKCFQMAMHLKSHMKLHEAVVGTDGCEFECDICGSTCSSQRSLDVHKLSVHKDGSFAHNCVQCGKGFHHKSHLREHFLVHLSSKNKGELKLLKCSSCSKTFTSDKKLHNHEILHVPKEKRIYSFPCAYCPQRFTLQSLRTAHERRKHDIVGYQCQTCHLKFVSKSALSAHEEEHVSPVDVEEDSF